MGRKPRNARSEYARPYMSRRAYWILEELRVLLRCSNFDELIERLAEIVAEAIKVGIVKVDSPLVGMLLSKTKPNDERRLIFSMPSNAARAPAPASEDTKSDTGEGELPSFLADNPWLEILRKRGG